MKNAVFCSENQLRNAACYPEETKNTKNERELDPSCHDKLKTKVAAILGRSATRAQDIDLDKLKEIRQRQPR